MPKPAVTLCLFGSFEVTIDGKPLPKFRTKKEWWLLALLALSHGKPLRRDTLAQILWPFPDSSRSQAAANLRRSLSQLRNAFSDHPNLIYSATPQTIALDTARIDADVVTFDQRIAKGDEASLQEAVALYQGPLLPAYTEPWILAERESRKQAYQQALIDLAMRCRARGDAIEAVRLLRRATAVDPLWELAQRSLMEALEAVGDLSGALTVYQEFCRRLRDNSQALPTRETSALALRLRHPAPVDKTSSGESAFPPLRRSLPSPLTRLVGRDGAIGEVSALLHRSRLVSLIGAGGVGKTRLSIAVAEAAATTMARMEVCFVDLAPLGDGSLATATVATVLEVREEPGQSSLEALVKHLSSRSVLLILDNCEHLLEDCAALSESLLTACPPLRILATSRQALGVPGETLWRVPSLEDGDAHRLFVERAQAARADFDVTPENAQTVAQVCRRLDSIPLAIELAAAQVRRLSVPQIAEGLEVRFAETIGSSRTRVARHRTLSALIDWSYDLLSSVEQELLLQLSVFSGGWTLEAVEAVADGERVGLHLDALVDQSLVVEEDARYRQMETVRQYALEKLAQRGADTVVRDRHRDYFLDVVEKAEQEIGGPDQVTWLRRLEADGDNLRAALTWSLHDPESEKGLRLAGAMAEAWLIHGRLLEGWEWFGKHLQKTEADAGSTTRAKALSGMGRIAYTRGEHVTARALYTEGLALYRRAEDRGGIAATLGHLGLVTQSQGDGTGARALIEDSLAIQREIGDRRGIAYSLDYLGGLAMIRGDYARARTLMEESLLIRRELKNKQGIAFTLGNLANLAKIHQDYATVRAISQEMLATFQEIGDRWGTASALGNLGLVALSEGDHAAARAFHTQSLVIYQEMGERWGCANALKCLGQVAQAQGDSVQARAYLVEGLQIARVLGERLLICDVLGCWVRQAIAEDHWAQGARVEGATERVREEIDAPLPPVDRDEQRQRVARMRAALGDAVFTEVWEAGRALSLEDAIQFALDASRA